MKAAGIVQRCFELTTNELTTKELTTKELTTKELTTNSTQRSIDSLQAGLHAGGQWSANPSDRLRAQAGFRWRIVPTSI